MNVTGEPHRPLARTIHTEDRVVRDRVLRRAVRRHEPRRPAPAPSVPRRTRAGGRTQLLGSGDQTVVSGVWPQRQGQLLTRAQTNRSCCPDRGHSSAKREGKGRHRDIQRGREDKKIKSKGVVVSAWGEWTERKNEKDAGKKDFFFTSIKVPFILNQRALERFGKPCTQLQSHCEDVRVSLAKPDPWSRHEASPKSKEDCNVPSLSLRRDWNTAISKEIYTD